MTWTRRGRSAGISARWIVPGFVFVGFVFVVAAATLGCKTPAPREELPPGPPELRGPGWRLRRGVVEDVGAALRLTIPSGWRVMTREETIDTAGEVEFALCPVDWRPGDRHVYLAVDGNPVGDGDIESNLEAQRTKTAEGWTTIGDPRPVAISGHVFDVQLAGWGSPTATSERLYAGGIVDRRFYELVLVYPVARTDELRPEFERLVDGVELLGRARTVQLAEELDQLPDPVHLIGADYAYRDGVFYDFAQGYQWRRTPGSWRMTVIEEPAERDPSQRLIASDLVTGTTVYVGTEASSDDDASYLAIMRDRIGTTTVTSEGPRAIGGLPGRTADLDVASIVPYTMQVNAARLGPRIASVVIDNLAATWPGDGYAAAAVNGFSVHPGMRPEDDGPPYASLRFGVGVELPPSWQRERAAEADRPGVLDRRWRRGDATFSLRVLSGKDTLAQRTAPVTWVTESLYPIATWGDPRRSAIALDGAVGTRLAWRANGYFLVVDVIDRSGVIYIVAQQRPSNTPGGDLARTALRFLR
jgi:hypothetical protein